MSEEVKGTSEQKDWALPEPDFPKLEMPEAPKTGLPDEVKVSCDGTVEVVYPNNDFVIAPEASKPRILIGIPVLTFSHEFVTGFLKFWTELCTMANGKFTAGYYFVYRKPVHMAEIEIVKVAQFNKCTHILFMDDDIYDVTLADLQKLIDADKDVIAGVMHASKFPHAMCVFRRYDTTKKLIDMPADNAMLRLYEVPCICPKCNNGLSHWDAKFCPVCGEIQNQLLQKVDLIPFCFTLMKTEIFNRIKKPWFHCTDGYPTDSWFADRCIEAGIQEWAHMGVRLNHAGVTDLTKPHHLNMGLDINRSKSRGLVQLSEEDMNKHQFILHQKMKEAEDRMRPQVAMLDESGGQDVGNKGN